jgi:hypothetical protein
MNCTALWEPCGDLWRLTVADEHGRLARPLPSAGVLLAPRHGFDEGVARLGFAGYPGSPWREDPDHPGCWSQRVFPLTRQLAAELEREALLAGCVPGQRDPGSG